MSTPAPTPDGILPFDEAELDESDRDEVWFSPGPGDPPAGSGDEASADDDAASADDDAAASADASWPRSTSGDAAG